MDRYAKYLATASAARGQVAELELVSTLHLADGTSQEVSNVRRNVCKRVARKRNSIVLEYVDVDRSALESTFPFETFTVADFPDLYVDHVGRAVTQGVGLVRKVPATWIVKTGGVWVYAGPKVIYGGAATCRAVYRGTQDGQGSVVDPSEYAIGVVTAPSGFTMYTITFGREQTDFSGKPYVIEADWTLPGSQSPSSEVARILQAFGFTADAVTFASAIAADIAAGFTVDALYAGRAGNAILEDLLQVARGWLSQTSTAAYAIVQDVAKTSTLQLDTAIDLIDVQDYGDPADLVKTVSLEYGTKRSAAEEYAYKLTRSVTNGSTGEKQMKNPYIQAHSVADRLICYWQKRLPKPAGSADVFAQQLVNGALVNINDATYWRGAKDFILTGISRPADLNRVKLREYDAAVYTYTAGNLPAGATNTYSPDYSFTPPAAPTGLAFVSQGASADTDGKVTAYQVVQASPPAVNWAQLWAQLTDTTTSEQYTQQLFWTGAAWQATIGGLRPNRLHSMIVWAVNANNVAGTTASIGNFTSANATNALAAPTVAVTQKQSFEVNIDLSAIADVAGQPKFRRYVLFEQVGGGAMAEVQRTPDRTLKRTVVHGTVYQYKVRSEDVNGNESADSSTVSITPAAVVNDTYIQTQGVSGTSIANSSINQARASSSTASQSGTILGTGVVVVGGGTSSGYGFAPSLTVGNSGSKIGTLGLNLTPTIGTAWSFMLVNNDPANQPYDAQWRQVAP